MYIFSGFKWGQIMSAIKGSDAAQDFCAGFNFAAQERIRNTPRIVSGGIFHLKPFF
jgi:hypothetical protein